MRLIGLVYPALHRAYKPQRSSQPAPKFQSITSKASGQGRSKWNALFQQEPKLSHETFTERRKRKWMLPYKLKQLELVTHDLPAPESFTSNLEAPLPMKPRNRVRY